MEHVLPRRDAYNTDDPRLVYGLVGTVLVLLRLRRKSWVSTALAVIGADMVSCALTGRHLHQALGLDGAHAGEGERTRIPHQMGVQVEDWVDVNTSPEHAYQFMRRLENLTHCLEHVKNVVTKNEKLSHWVVKAPAGTEVEWDAEIINDLPGKLIAWRSINDPDVDSAGSVHFEPLRTDGGTRIRVRMQYLPPAGSVGVALAKLLGEEPEQQLRDDLQRLKSALEQRVS
jgi:uncharacterized membrane protein